MQSNKRVTPSRQPVKTATRTVPVARSVAPARATVRSAAPVRNSRQQFDRYEVETHVPTHDCAPICRKSDKPCGDAHSHITFHGCDTMLKLTCIVKNDNVITNGSNLTVIPGSDLDKQFPSISKIQGCAQTDCINPDETHGTITPVTVVSTTVVTQPSHGNYSVTRIYLVTDSCGNTELFAFTITFTINDGAGPIITISDPPAGASQCSDGTNPHPECECVFLHGCRPDQATIDAALGQGTADGCDANHPVTVTYCDSPEQKDGCYTYIMRTFTAFDECCNKGTACRVVRWLDDSIIPTVTISPTLDELKAAGYHPCNPNPTPGCECIDLGCNPADTQAKVDALVNTILGVGHALDTCGPAQVCTKNSKVNGTCCDFSQTRTFTATDPCGNHSDKKCRTVIWTIDREGPIVQCLSDKILPCGTVDPTQYFDVPDVFDNCDGCLHATLQSNVGPIKDADGNVTYTRTWKIPDDSCGNPPLHSTVSQTITIDCSPDCPTANGPLQISCGNTITIPCGTVPTAASFPDVTIITYCGDFSNVIATPSSTITKTPVTDGSGVIIGYNYTRLITVTDSCGHKQTCTQTLYSKNCPPGVTAKGCSRGFYSRSGAQTWDQSTDPLVDTINTALVVSNQANPPQRLPFSQGTDFLQYFGFLPGDSGCTGITAGTTMLQAINLPGGGCSQLAAQGIAALLNMAAFGSSYIIPTTCTATAADGGGPINTLKKLYDAIQAALTSCHCDVLEGCLDVANNHEGLNGIYCSSLLVDAPVQPKKFGLRTQPVKPALRQQAAPAPQRLAVPVARQTIAPQQKTFKKSFIPGNAQ